MKVKWFLLMKLVYVQVLRPLVAEKIESSPGEWDDKLLELLDRIFDYDGTGK